MADPHTEAERSEPGTEASGAPVEIRPMEASDWERVAEIYAGGIATGHATFETEVPSYESWDRSHLEVCRLVAEDGGRVAGWAALSPVSDRCVYGGVAEVSIYVDADARGKGVGTALFRRLIECSEARGFWTLQAGIFPENEASVRLHEKLGFRRVGLRERLGELDGEWRDVLLLERRSDRVGTD